MQMKNAAVSESRDRPTTVRASVPITLRTFGSNKRSPTTNGLLAIRNNKLIHNSNKPEPFIRNKPVIEKKECGILNKVKEHYKKKKALSPSTQNYMGYPHPYLVKNISSRSPLKLNRAKSIEPKYRSDKSPPPKSLQSPQNETSTQKDFENSNKTDEIKKHTTTSPFTNRIANRMNFPISREKLALYTEAEFAKTFNENDYSIQRKKRQRDENLEYYQLCDSHGLDICMDHENNRLLLVREPSIPLIEEIESENETLNYEELDSAPKECGHLQKQFKKILYVDMAVKRLEPRVVRLSYLYKGALQEDLSGKKKILFGVNTTGEAVEIDTEELLNPKSYKHKHFRKKQKKSADKMVKDFENRNMGASYAYLIAKEEAGDNESKNYRIPAKSISEHLDRSNIVRKKNRREESLMGEANETFFVEKDYRRTLKFSSSNSIKMKRRNFTAKEEISFKLSQIKTKTRVMNNRQMFSDSSLKSPLNDPKLPSLNKNLTMRNGREGDTKDDPFRAGYPVSRQEPDLLNIDQLVSDRSPLNSERGHSMRSKTQLEERFKWDRTKSSPTVEVYHLKHDSINQSPRKNSSLNSTALQKSPTINKKDESEGIQEEGFQRNLAKLRRKSSKHPKEKRYKSYYNLNSYIASFITRPER